MSAAPDQVERYARGLSATARPAVPDRSRLSFAARPVLVAAGLLALGSSALLTSSAGAGTVPMTAVVVSWFAIAALVLHVMPISLRRDMGIANAITVLRAALVAVLIGLIPIAASLDAPLWWAATAIATIALSLDGLDGYLARRHGQCTAFGARFDMETDALLGAVMALLLWAGDVAGPWVLVLAAPRYLFLLAARRLPALNAPLFPSWRRKTVCVVQVGALVICLAPIVSTPLSSVLIAAASIALLASFARDVHWLLSGHGDPSPTGTSTGRTSDDLARSPE